MRDKQGMTAAFFALMLAAIIGLGAISIDMAQSYSVRTRVKSAVDLSTLAGISQLISQSNVGNAKNVALQYLNNNLTVTLPSFSPLTLDSNGVSIQVGIYDFNTMIFTQNETGSSVNAIKISYVYNSSTYLAYFFMINNIQVTENSIAAKQIVGQLPPGSGFPLAIATSVLSDARTNSNMFDLVQAGSSTNSYFTALSASNASANDIKSIIQYFQNPTGNIQPPTLNVGDDFQINNGSLTSVYMALDPSFFVGMTFVSPVITVDSGFSNTIMVEGFVGYTINNIYKVGNDYHIAGTVIPSYIDSLWGGGLIGGGVGNVSFQDQPLLADSFGLVN